MPIITVSDLKSHLSISGAQHDPVVAFAVNAANQAVVQHCGRSFDKVTVGQETARVYQSDDPCHVIVDDFYSITNLAVATDDDDDGTYETTWTAADYVLEPLNGMKNGIAVPYYRIRAVGSREFPTYKKHPSVRVTAAWGWASVPDAVKQATLLKAARLFWRKDSPQGVAGFDQFGPIRLSSREDGDVIMLLSDFRRIEQFAGV